MILKSVFNVVFSCLSISLTTLAGFPALAAYPDGYSCELKTREELHAEARRTLKNFASLNGFDPLFFLPKESPHRDSLGLHFQNKLLRVKNHLAIRQKLSAVEVAALELIGRLKRDPRLAPLTQKDFLQLDLTGEENCDGAPACISYGDYSVVFSSKFLDETRQKLGGEEADRIVLAIMGHEIGHMVFDIERFVNGEFQSYEDSIKDLNPLKYHVVTDAIGMQLTGLNVEEYISSLEATILGESRHGDIPARIKCLRELK